MSRIFSPCLSGWRRCRSFLSTRASNARPQRWRRPSSRCVFGPAVVLGLGQGPSCAGPACFDVAAALVTHRSPWAAAGRGSEQLTREINFIPPAVHVPGPRYCRSPCPGRWVWNRAPVKVRGALRHSALPLSHPLMSHPLTPVPLSHPLTPGPCLPHGCLVSRAILRLEHEIRSPVKVRAGMPHACPPLPVPCTLHTTSFTSCQGLRACLPSVSVSAPASLYSLAARLFCCASVCVCLCVPLYLCVPLFLCKSHCPFMYRCLCLCVYMRRRSSG
jgi:hypothetical protein